MFGLKAVVRRTSREEAEKPFWISFSDQMTALMALFLVAMAATLLAITQAVVSAPDEHARKIDACLADVTAMSRQFDPDIIVRDQTIDFGARARFATNQHKLDAPAETILRAYVPRLLGVMRAPTCHPVFKRVIVEGYASQKGTYLHNLNLSLQRAQRVLCVLLDADAGSPLDETNRRLVRNYFLVGGFSFNALKPSDAESQRVELKLDFLRYGETPEPVREAPLDSQGRCPLDR